MVKHFCDVCKKEILSATALEYTGEKNGMRFKVQIYATSLPGGKRIELCEECILKAIRSV